MCLSSRMIAPPISTVNGKAQVRRHTISMDPQPSSPGHGRRSDDGFADPYAKVISHRDEGPTRNDVAVDHDLHGLVHELIELHHRAFLEAHQVRHADLSAAHTHSEANLDRPEEWPCRSDKGLMALVGVIGQRLQLDLIYEG